MTLSDIQTKIALGEDSSRQFKVYIRNAESLAAEMAAFANSAEGTIFIGVADDGTMPGLVSRHYPGYAQRRIATGADRRNKATLQFVLEF